MPWSISQGLERLPRPGASPKAWSVSQGLERLPRPGAVSQGLEASPKASERPGLATQRPPGGVPPGPTALQVHRIGRGWVFGPGECFFHLDRIVPSRASN